MTHDIGAPMPAGEHLHRLAASFARPVARDWMPIAQADGALIAAAVRARREGRLGPYQASDVVAGLRTTLRMKLKAERWRRAMAENRICRVLRPLIGTGKKSNVLLAEAHGVNGEDGFPLTEDEVTDIVATEVWHSLPAGVRRRG